MLFFVSSSYGEGGAYSGFLSSEPIIPIPLVHQQNPLKANIGKLLYNDPRLSADNTVSCASCHRLELGGTDRLATSIGVKGAKGPVNAPTVFNSAFNFLFFWDGRAASLEAQIDGPIHNQHEMASSWPEILDKLKADKDLLLAIQQAYAEPLSEQVIKDAIASYEKTLITPNSPFDRYLRGDLAALGQRAKRGYKLFKSYGCSSCHQGVNVGGNMFERMGVVRDYFSERGNLTRADYGRYNVTGKEEHKFEFKVPSLRNIAETAPYFHDGSAQSLEAAVEVMAYYQLGRKIPPADQQAIVAFLHSLTGELPEDAK
ncbi:hypothetical protein GCM10011338_15400 [Alteromonas lipolytica]|uniref:Cytochrome B6 n=1 Tax=Alteromonas lipolytica TaxID=1856405 RepID=A0A1E8FAL3_9ALTE|nr:cytochrome B6 [Alteromonas lipolytica]GGF63972.1 hypothetical protein GCM10011338_15400 [Alteromonas lipolytica]